MSFSSSINLSSLNGTNGFRLDGVAAGDYSGLSVASAGDVNSDGLADIIIGAYGSNIGAGASYVVFGKSSGFDSSINLSSLNGANGFRLDGVLAHQWSGASVASAGDVNGDGITDLIISAPNAGANYVIFGKVSGFASSINFSILNGTNGFRLDGAAAGDQIYWSAPAGDVNGDGLADIIIGATHADPNGTDSGSSYVVFGKASGFVSTFNLSSLNGTNGFRLDGVSAHDYSGTSVASAGDVNGDGFADIIIGASGADPNGSGSGSGYVVFGKASGFTSSINLSSLDGSTGFRLDGVAANEAMSRVSSAGDVNGDGYADLIVGASGANGQAGASYVVFGKASGFASTINLSTLNGSTGFKLTGVTANDRSGSAVSSVGDVNGDGLPDLIIGAAWADPNGTDSGASYVVYGTAIGGVTYRGTTLADNLHGTAFGDSITGNAGNDILTGGAGNDTIDCGAGNDTVIWASGDGNDTITLGTGSNIMGFYSNAFTYVDSGPQRIFTIDSATVTVTDWTAGTNSVAIYNTAPTVTSSSTASFAENATGTVYTATGTDPDTGTTLTYALGGVDAGRFNINAASGVVTFKASPDFEAPADVGGNNVYDITVTASDGNLSSVAKAVAITVTNVNEAPSVTSAATASFAENATGTVYTATGTDTDAGTTLTFVLGGTDASLFNINSATGAVTFKASPNFEAPTDAGANNIYDITVTAFDGNASSAAKAVAVTVTNVDDSSVSIAAISASKVEGQSGSTPFTFIATRTGDTSAAQTANWAVTGSGTNAATASDFVGAVLPSGTVSFGIGETSKTITVNVLGETSLESDEGFTVSLSNPSAGLVLSAATATATIQNDDAAAYGTFGGKRYAVMVNDTPISWTDARARAHTQGGDLVSITSQAENIFVYDLINLVPSAWSFNPYWGASVEGPWIGGYQPLGSTEPLGGWLWVSGEPFVFTSWHFANPDNWQGAAGPENYINYNRLHGGSVWNDSAEQQNLVISYVIEFPGGPIDNASVSIAAISASKVEGQSGSTPFTFTALRTGDTSTTQTAAWAVSGSGSNAAIAADFVGNALPTGTVSFGVGETSKTITIDVAGDTAVENDEGFTVSLSNPSAGLVLGASTASGSIINDDRANGPTSGADTLIGTPQSDTLDGLEGDDSLMGLAGDDLLYGGAGADTLTGGAGNDTLDGGDGYDTASFSGAMASYRFAYDDSVLILTGPDATDRLSNIEAVSFGSGNAVSIISLIGSGVIEEIMSVQTGGITTKVIPSIYSGPVSWIKYEMLGNTASDVIVGTSKNDFINLMGGDDAANGGAGDDVIDGGTGSNFLSGGAGRDDFFLDGRGGTTTWATITDWSAGERLSVWGWRPGVSKVQWVDNTGAPGWAGVTMHGDLDGNGVIDTSVTWTGLSRSQLPTPLEFDGLLWFT